MQGRKQEGEKTGMKVTTLYLPKDLVDKAKARGINISETVREYLKAVLEDEERLKLEEIEKEILELEKRLAHLRAQREALRKRQEEKLAKENREEAIRRTLEEIKATFELLKKRAGSKEEIELKQRLLKLKSRLTLVTGITEGSAEWTEIMRALNTQGVSAAVEVAKKWST